MRAIKFRAWDKLQNKMRTSFAIHNENGYPFTIHQGQEFYQHEWIVMQYIGLKDKNGKKIYEGDINLDDGNRRSEVVFYAGGFYFKYSETEYKSIGSFASFNYLVIGNIYENPERLTAKERE